MTKYEFVGRMVIDHGCTVSWSFAQDAFIVRCGLYEVDVSVALIERNTGDVVSYVLGALDEAWQHNVKHVTL